MIVKKLILFVVGLCLLLSVGVVQAKEDYNFKWQKVGDSYFDVCNFERVYFIENVENYNEVKMRSVPREVQEQMDWKTLKSTYSLRKSTVKEWNAGKLTEVYHVIGYNYLSYEGKKLSLKYFLDSGSRFIFREENTETPNIQPSKDGTYFIFEDGDEIWSIVPPNIEEPNYIVKKLTDESVNGKNRQEIQKQLKDGDSVIRAFSPMVNTNGSYVAYISNKDSYSRGEKGISEIWVIDAKNGKEFNVLHDSYAYIYGWIDNYSFVCSLKDNKYIYNVETQEITPLPSNINILHINDNTIVYANKDNRSQLYSYDVKANAIKAFPKLTDNLFFLADTPVPFYSLSPSKEKFLLIAEKREANAVNGQYTLFMLDLHTDKVYSVDYPASLEKVELLSGMGPWISENQLVVYAQYNENKMQMYRTWILLIDKEEKK